MKAFNAKDGWDKVKTYVFKVELEEEDGRWSAVMPALPGCATEGDSKEEALEALREAAQAYIEVMHQYGDPLPEQAQEEVAIINSPDTVAVSV